MTIGMTKMNRTTASAAPKDSRPSTKLSTYLLLAAMSVSLRPCVSVRTMSETLSEAIVMVVRTTTSVARMAGIVMNRKRCQGLAPSSDAASFISMGTPLMAAEMITMAKPVWIHTKMKTKKIVFHGDSVRKLNAGNPIWVSKALSMPVWVPTWLKSYMIEPQITEAPTKETAIGMNTRDFRIFSPLARSMNTAYARPMPVDSAGTSTIQSRVLMIDRSIVGSVTANW